MCVIDQDWLLKIHSRQIGLLSSSHQTSYQPANQLLTTKPWHSSCAEWHSQWHNETTRTETVFVGVSTSHFRISSPWDNLHQGVDILLIMECRHPEIFISEWWNVLLFGCRHPLKFVLRWHLVVIMEWISQDLNKSGFTYRTP